MSRHFTHRRPILAVAGPTTDAIFRTVSRAFLGAAGIALVVTSACASSPGKQQAAEIVGCWYFVHDDAARDLRLPWGVRLTDEELQGWPALQQLEGVRRAATLTPSGDADHPFGYWRPLPGDSLLMGYPAGGGLSVRLEVEPSRLVGTARPVGDARPLNPRPAEERAVSLTRARCPEEG